MIDKSISNPKLFFINNILIGENTIKIKRTYNDIYTIFRLKKEMSDEVIYEVKSCLENEIIGGLNFGITYLYPGKVGNEYYMTKGHFHLNKNSTEYYWGIEGEGILLLMDESRHIQAERMFPGSLHYIKPNIAHRVCNIGTILLSFGACWPSDAGHDYLKIEEQGFSGRIIEVNGKPQLVKE